MNSPKFYFEHSLLGYFCRRAKDKWFTQLPAQLNYHGVLLQLDSLPMIMQKVIISGHYEFPEAKLISTLVSPTDRVLEIGSAIGFVGLLCRKVLGVGTLVGVEPNPKTLLHLRRNYEINGVEPNIIEAAIAPADGPISFNINDLFWVDSLIAGENGNQSTKITVQGLTFSTILDRANETFNTLIIDVEGGEKYLPVKSIPDSVKKIVIEIHPDAAGERATYNILETLIRLGFNVHGQLESCWAFLRD